MSYGSPTPPYGPPQPHAPKSPEQPARQPNLGLGIVAGFGAGIVGAIVWGGFTGVTHYRFALVSLALGFFVGWAMVKAAGRPGKELGIAAAIITLLACAAGDVGTVYVDAMHQTGASLSELMNVRGLLGVLSDDLSSDKLGVVFFAIAAYFAFQFGTTGAAGRGRRRIAGRRVYGAPPPIPPQPQFDVPTAAEPQPQPQPQHQHQHQPQFGSPEPVPSPYFGDATQPPDAGFVGQPPAGTP